MPPLRVKTGKKNQKIEDWRSLAVVIKQREREGKNSNVYRWGEKISRREFNRCKNDTWLRSVAGQHFQHKLKQGYLPLGFGIVSPISPEMLCEIQKSLPFPKFDREMLDDIRVKLTVEQPWPSIMSAGSWEINDNNPDMHLVDFPDSSPSKELSAASCSLEVSDLKSLELEELMPSVYEDELWTDDLNADLSLSQYISPLYRRIMFSISNNFVGLDTHSHEQVIGYLRVNTSPDLYELISSNTSYTARSIMRNLFKGAIEAGDATVVRTLLQTPSAKIEPDLEVCNASGAKWTPIERAAALRHHDVIEVLLGYGVDINKTISPFGQQLIPYVLYQDEKIQPVIMNFYPMGALSHAIVGVNHEENRKVALSRYKTVDKRIVKQLLYSDSRVDLDILEFLIRAGDSDLFIEILQAIGMSHQTEWSQHGLFHHFFWVFDIEACKMLLEVLVGLGVNLNHHFYPTQFSKGYSLVGNNRNSLKDMGKYTPISLIDEVALKGDVSMAHRIIENGAHPTKDTLACAILSGQRALIDLFLETCAIDDIGYLKITPLAAAIRLNSADIVNLVESRGAWVHLWRIDQYISVLSATSETGNVAVLERLVDHGGGVTPEHLGIALIELIEKGQDKLAYDLIEAGANLGMKGVRGVSAVQAAIKRKNEHLIFTLLDAGADPYLDLDECFRNWEFPFDSRGNSIESAAKLGNFDIIKRLIWEGAYKGTKSTKVFNFAIEHGETELIDILIQAGTLLDLSSYYDSNGPLSRAVKKGDICMIRLLLDHGIGLDDEGGLIDAYTPISKDIKELIIEKHRKVYIQSKPGFGSGVLKNAIIEGDESRIKEMLNDRMDPSTLHYNSADLNKMISSRKERTLFEEYTECSPFGFAIALSQPNRTDLVKTLLSGKCDPNGVVACNQRGKFHEGITALAIAVGTNDISLVRLLVERGANVNLPAIGRIKRTPLQRAAEVASYEMVEFLIHLGAEVNAAPAARYGGTALQLAAISGNVRVVRLLLEHGAEVDARACVTGHTALEGAAKNGRLDTVKMLLNAYKVQSKRPGPEQFRRAKEYAREEGHFEVVDLLEDEENCQSSEVQGEVVQDRTDMSD